MEAKWITLLVFILRRQLSDSKRDSIYWQETMYSPGVSEPEVLLLEEVSR